MGTAQTDVAFTGSIPEMYEHYMVPLIFEPYAADLARRVAAARPQRVVELAAGTGAVTRRLSAMLPDASRIVATDLNPAMIQKAQGMGTPRPVEWQVADAMQLPFEHGSFDAVACQFGVMFFPDRPHAYGEARRVLRTGGLFAFNAWTEIEGSEMAKCISDALARLFPEDPPNFMARTPHGYHDPVRIESDIAAAGFTSKPLIERVSFTSRAASARTAAIAYCQGTPWRGEIEARDPAGTERATDAAEKALVARFGTGPIEGRIEALVVTVTA